MSGCGVSQCVYEGRNLAQIEILSTQRIQYVLVVAMICFRVARQGFCMMPISFLETLPSRLHARFDS